MPFYLSGQNLFDQNKIHQIHINLLNDVDWEELEESYGKRDNYSESIYFPAKVNINQYCLDSVGIRLKGVTSYFTTFSDKKPIKLDLNEFIKGQNLFGLKKLNLHNGSGDPTMMREFLAYHFLNKIGAPSPITSFSKVYVNNKYWGVYLLVEQIDKPFFKKNLWKR